MMALYLALQILLQRYLHTHDYLFIFINLVMRQGHIPIGIQPEQKEKTIQTHTQIEQYEIKYDNKTKQNYKNQVVKNEYS